MSRAGLGILVGVLLVGWSSRAKGQEIRWYHSLAEAKKVAKEKGLPLFLDVGTDNCFWCKKLDATTFRDPEVARLLDEHFIPVKVDASKDPGWAHAMGISAFPTLVFTGSDGTQLHRENGYADAVRMRGLLTRLKQVESNPGQKGISGNGTMQIPSAFSQSGPISGTALKLPPLPGPHELGVSTTPISWVRGEINQDLGPLFTQMRELGVVGMRVEKLDGAYKVRLEIPATSGNIRVLQGSGPSENAALAQALAAAGKQP